MNEYYQQKYQEMCTYIEGIKRNHFSTIREAEAIYTYINQIMVDLKDYVIANNFNDTESEIKFFKDIKPAFESLQIYYREIFHIHNHLLENDEKKALEMEQQRTLIKKHFKKHHYVYTYYQLGKSSLDQWLFLRDVEDIPFITHRPIVHRDSRFETIGSYRFAKFKAYESLVKYLEDELKKLGSPQMENEQPKLKWTGQKVQLVELIYALKVAGVFNHGQAELKEVAQTLEQLIGAKVGDIYRVFQEIRLRKKGRTLFLDALKEKLEGYMEEADGL